MLDIRKCYNICVKRRWQSCSASSTRNSVQRMIDMDIFSVKTDILNRFLDNDFNRHIPTAMKRNFEEEKNSNDISKIKWKNKINKLKKYKTV